RLLFFNSICASHVTLLSMYYLPLPRPPSSTLFPYTTLFRSIVMDEANKKFTLGGKEFHEGDSISIDGTTGNIYDGIIPTVDATIDRKSTRLNSSHVSISYAVFCLKKKKKNINN